MIPNAYVNRTLQRMYEAHNTEFHVLRYSAEQSSETNIYNERVNKAYEDPITCLGYLEVEPSELRLEELGWHKEPVEFIIKVAINSLIDSELVTKEGKILFGTSDKLHVPAIDLTYKISHLQRVQPFVNGLPTYLHIGGRKYSNG